MNADQRADVVTYLGGGARMREAANIVGAGWPDFSKDWRDGRRAVEAGEDSGVGRWYIAASSARAKHIAGKRAEAAATAGSRESADLLAYVKSLEAEEEPLADDDSDNPRRSPGFRAHDLIAEGKASPELRAAHEAYERAGLALFDLIVNLDAQGASA